MDDATTVDPRPGAPGDEAIGPPAVPTPDPAPTWVGVVTRGLWRQFWKAVGRVAR
jgi:hypothetical protein